MKLQFCILKVIIYNNDDKCFQYDLTVGLNYEDIKKKSIALSILYIPYNTKEITYAYKSKYVKRENQVILLMITDCKKFACIG